MCLQYSLEGDRTGCNVGGGGFVSGTGSGKKAIAVGGITRLMDSATRKDMMEMHFPWNGE